MFTSCLYWPGPRCSGPFTMVAAMEVNEAALRTRKWLRTPSPHKDFNSFCLFYFYFSIFVKFLLILSVFVISLTLFSIVYFYLSSNCNPGNFNIFMVIRKKSLFPHQTRRGRCDNVLSDVHVYQKDLFVRISLLKTNYIRSTMMSRNRNRPSSRRALSICCCVRSSSCCPFAVPKTTAATSRLTHHYTTAL